MTKFLIRGLFFIATVILISACATSRPEPVADGFKQFDSTDAKAEDIVPRLPDYKNTLKTVKGKGKAIISEPENSQRATLYFSSNHSKSLITAKNSIGIEGGKLLTDGDTLTVYNKVDKFARIIPIKNSNLQRINRLASLNLLQMLNYPVQAEQVDKVFEDENLYLLSLKSGTNIFVSKENFLIRQVNQPSGSGLPYSTILYEGYDTVNGFKLPRRITVYSTDRASKIDLLIQSLETNPELEELKIELPDDIKIYRQ